jgi:hypothetical protein
MNIISAKHKVAGILASVLLASAPLIAGPLATQAQAAGGMMCRAHMQDTSPKQYTYDRVFVRTAPHANIRTVAHYKTTDTRKFAKANRHGRGSTNYYISGATPGDRVWVEVFVSKPGRTGHCRASFVPHR